MLSNWYLIKLFAMTKKQGEKEKMMLGEYVTNGTCSTLKIILGNIPLYQSFKINSYLIIEDTLLTAEFLENTSGYEKGT